MHRADSPFRDLGLPIAFVKEGKKQAVLIHRDQSITDKYISIRFRTYRTRLNRLNSWIDLKVNEAHWRFIIMMLTSN